MADEVAVSLDPIVVTATEVPSGSLSGGNISVSGPQLGNILLQQSLAREAASAGLSTTGTFAAAGESGSGWEGVWPVNGEFDWSEFGLFNGNGGAAQSISPEAVADQFDPFGVAAVSVGAHSAGHQPLVCSGARHSRISVQKGPRPASLRRTQPVR